MEEIKDIKHLDDEKRRKAAFVSFAKIAIANSKAYQGSKNIDEKIDRMNRIKEALTDARYRESFAYHNSSNEPLNEGNEELSSKHHK